MSVTVRFDPAVLSPQSQIIYNATPNNDGVMTATQAEQLALLVALAAGGFGPKIFSNLTRPAANDPQFADILADGRVAVIWNSSSSQPNYSDGVNWYDADGNID